MSRRSPLDALGRRVATNVRYYRGRLAEHCDAWQIRHLASRRYARLDPPAWNAGHAAKVRSPDSALSKLLAAYRDPEGDAALVVAGQFRLFADAIEAEQGIPDWHRDYLSDHRYPLRPYPLIRVEVDGGSDIVSAWELSRLQFVPSLVAAHRGCGETSIADRFFELLDDWRSRNPYLQGVNWVCGLDIAIRACNIAFGLIHFDEPGSGRWQRGSHLLWAHLAYLQERDLYVPKRIVNNHQSIALAMHFALLHLFSGPVAAQCRTQAGEALVAEIVRQFRPDGGNFESALGYHQFVLESLCVATALVTPEDPALALRDGGALSGVAADRIRHAFRFTRSYAGAYGAMPQIGDSSDGRILFLSDYFAWRSDDPTYLADWSALLLGDEDPFRKAPSSTPSVFAESGLAAFGNTSYGVVISAMPVDTGAAGHNHLDRTAFVMAVRGQPLLVDCGTGCYTSDLVTRSELRAGRSHNLLLVNSGEPGRLCEAGVFATPDFGSSGVSVDSARFGCPTLHAWHHGYDDSRALGRIDRALVCRDDALEIHDSVAGSGNADLELIFNLHPGVDCELEGGSATIAIAGRTLARLQAPHGWAAAIEPARYSESYRAVRSTIRLVFRLAAAKLPSQALTRIEVCAT